MLIGQFLLDWILPEADSEARIGFSNWWGSRVRGARGKVGQVKMWSRVQSQLSVTLQGALEQKPTPHTLSHLEEKDLGFIFQHQSALGFSGCREETPRHFSFPSRTGAEVLKGNPLKLVPCGKSSESSSGAGVNRSLRRSVTSAASWSWCVTVHAACRIWNLLSFNLTFTKWIFFLILTMCYELSYELEIHMKWVQQIGNYLHGAE